MAKVRASGADAQLLAAFETSYAGALPADFFKMQFKSTDLSEEKGMGEDELLGLGRDASDPYFERPTDTGDIEIPLDTQSTGIWLKGLFGDPTTTGTGPYIHTFEAGGDVPSMAFEIGHTKLTTPQFFRHVGAKLGGLSFDMSDGAGPANASLSIIAQSEELAATTVDDTPTGFSLKRFQQSGAEIRMGGSQLGHVTGGSFQFENGLEAITTIRADGKIDGVDEGIAKASGGLTVRHSDDQTLINAANAEAPVSLQMNFLTADGSGDKLSFVMPRVFLQKPKKSISGPGGIEMNFDWRAATDPVAGYMLRAILTNDVDAY